MSEDKDKEPETRYYISDDWGYVVVVVAGLVVWAVVMVAKMYFESQGACQ